MSHRGEVNKIMASILNMDTEAFPPLARSTVTSLGFMVDVWNISSIDRINRPRFLGNQVRRIFLSHLNRTSLVE